MEKQWELTPTLSFSDEVDQIQVFWQGASNTGTFCHCYFGQTKVEMPEMIDVYTNADGAYIPDI